MPASEAVTALAILAWLHLERGEVAAGMTTLDRIVPIVETHDRHPAGPTLASERSQILLALGRWRRPPPQRGSASTRLPGRPRTVDRRPAPTVQPIRRTGRAWTPARRRCGAPWRDRVGAHVGASYDHMGRALLDMLAGDLVNAPRGGRRSRRSHIPGTSATGETSSTAASSTSGLGVRKRHCAASRPQAPAWNRDRRFNAAILTTRCGRAPTSPTPARAHRDPAAEDSVRTHADDLVTAHKATTPDPFAAHPFYVAGPAWGASWMAELSRVTGTNDPQAWAVAGAAWTDLRRPHRAAYALWRQAEALLLGGHGTEAGTCLRAAAAAALQHEPLRAGIHSLARLARIDLSAGRPPRPREPALYGLTDRELTVLRLVAEGLSNAQIGQRLFISDKTASVHITNILRKLGATNRTHAATLAQRAGLLEAERS